MAAPADTSPGDPESTVKIVPAAVPPPPAAGGRRRAVGGLIAGLLTLGVVAGGVAVWWPRTTSPPPPSPGMMTLAPPRPPDTVAPTVAPEVGAPPKPPEVALAPPAPSPGALAALAPPPGAPPSPPPPPPEIVPAIAPAPPIPLRAADEATLLADDPATLAVFQFAQNPAVIVLDFPTLAQQGHMMNRVAVLVEKAGTPHDRLLDDAELDAVIRGGGDTPESFYLGHDYRASELLRFFALAERDHVELDDDEKWLRRLVRQLGWTADGPAGALITLPRLDPRAGIDETLRRAILRHELSHGEYFTNPAYAAFVHRFWSETMTREDRAAMTTFLAHDHYDTGIEDLIINEAIAYLIHTPDERFFSAAIGKLPARHLAELRADFRRDMPPGWLRDDTPTPLPAAGAAAPRRITRPRRRYGLVSTVSTSKTVAVRRFPWRLLAASIAARKSLR